MTEQPNRLEQAQENLALALANDPRTATPEEASEAYLELTSMISHRGDGIPTQYVHGPKVAEAASTMWKALITALRTPSPTNPVEGVAQRVACRLRQSGLYTDAKLADELLAAALRAQPVEHDALAGER